MQQDVKTEIDTTIKSLLKTKEMIYFGIQLTDAIQRETIQPQHFEKNLIVPEPHAETGIYFELDWSKDPDILKLTAEDALIHIASYAIIICKESYPSIFWVKEHEHPDLFSAQTILKLIRDAMGHMKTRSCDHAAPFWSINKTFQRIYKIERLGIILDATQLHDKQLKFSQMGGITNLIRIIDFLIDDLEKKSTTHKKQIY